MMQQLNPPRLVIAPQSRPRPAFPPRTSLMRESSSTRGFSKSSVVTFWALSRVGPKRDRIVASHSWPRLAIALAALCAL